tara:strand:- start:157 stop:321 length:165 start_codon:yes stop_codon:yes gene_type:complete
VFSEGKSNKIIIKKEIIVFNKNEKKIFFTIEFGKIKIKKDTNPNTNIFISILKI